MPKPGKILGGCSRERLEPSSMERGRSGTSLSPRGRRQCHNPRRPIPATPWSVFSLLGRADLGLFGMFFLLLPSCMPGQDTPAPWLWVETPNPEPMVWSAPQNAALGERGNPSLSLFFLLFFFFISTFIFPSLGVAQLNRRLLSLCPPWAHRRQLPPPCSDCNSSRLFKKTPQNPPILAPADWCAAGGVGVSTGTRR